MPNAPIIPEYASAYSNHVELTPRQIDVARLLPHGRPIVEVARSLRLAERTAQMHVRGLLERTGMRNLRQLTVWSYVHGACCR